jgi:hypothetical protein
MFVGENFHFYIMINYSKWNILILSHFCHGILPIGNYIAAVFLLFEEKVLLDPVRQIFGFKVVYSNIKFREVMKKNSRLNEIPVLYVKTFDII